jgi:hypothetical protein
MQVYWWIIKPGEIDKRALKRSHLMLFFGRRPGGRALLFELGAPFALTARLPALEGLALGLVRLIYAISRVAAGRASSCRFVLVSAPQ